MVLFVFVAISEIMIIFFGSSSCFCGKGELHKINMAIWKQYDYKKFRFIFPPQVKKYKTTLPLILNYLIEIIIFVCTIMFYVLNGIYEFANMNRLLIFFYAASLFTTGLIGIGASVVTYRRESNLREEQIKTIISECPKMMESPHEIMKECITKYDNTYSRKEIEKTLKRISKT